MSAPATIELATVRPLVDAGGQVEAACFARAIGPIWPCNRARPAPRCRSRAWPALARAGCCPGDSASGTSRELHRHGSGETPIRGRAPPRHPGGMRRRRARHQPRQRLPHPPPDQIAGLRAGLHRQPRVAAAIRHPEHRCIAPSAWTTSLRYAPRCAPRAARAIRPRPETPPWRSSPAAPA